MAKNFDYILLVAEKVPGFKRLHEYCDKAESFQKSYPEESANNARKALEWLVRNMLKMKDVQINEHDTLSDLINKRETYDFINHDKELREAIRKVKTIGNSASHYGAERVKRATAFTCLRSLFYVVAGFMYRWGAMKSIKPFEAGLVPESPTSPVAMTSPDPQVEPDVVKSVPKENVEHPQVPEMPRESLESEAITRKYLIDYMLIEAGWDILEVNGDIQGGKACIEVEVDGMPTKSGKGRADYVLFSDEGQTYLANAGGIPTRTDVQIDGFDADQYKDCILMDDTDAYSAACEEVVTRWQNEITPLLVQ